MQKVLTMAMVMMLSGLLATAVLANQNPGNGNPKAQKNVTQNAAIEKKRGQAIEKVAKIRGKREETRAKVDALMDQRLQMIRQNDPGNLGPVGN